MRAAIAGAILLFVAALFVRGIPAERVRLPEDVAAEEDQPRIAEPMQFLARGAGLRAAELDALVRADRKVQFVATRGLVFHLADCPPLAEWLATAEGQRTERLLADLRTGSREEALAALTLIFQLARASDWAPGVLTGPEHAERLGGLLQDWLRVWGERGASDPTLAEPSLSAALLYARVMRAAWREPVLGFNEAPHARARDFLLQMTGYATSTRTVFGESLQARFGRAAARLAGDRDVLLGLEEECIALHPELDGECDG